METNTTGAGQPTHIKGPGGLLFKFTPPAALGQSDDDSSLPNRRQRRDNEKRKPGESFGRYTLPKRTPESHARMIEEIKALQVAHGLRAAEPIAKTDSSANQPFQSYLEQLVELARATFEKVDSAVRSASPSLPLSSADDQCNIEGACIDPFDSPLTVA